MVKRRKKNTSRVSIIIWSIIIIFSVLVFAFQDHPYVQRSARNIISWFQNLPAVRTATNENAIQNTNDNYGKEIDKLAAEYDLPASYLKALVVLECSGRKPVKPRFEKHVFRRLQRIRDGGRYKLEGISEEVLKNASDEALENLARSWGPFQLMGYKCLQLDVNVRDIRGEDALELGMRWIKKEYGHLLKSKRYRDAFHYHNTGKYFPSDNKSLTHDPLYVEKGLQYMQQFNAK